MKKILHILLLPKLAGSQMVSLEILKSLPEQSYEKWVLFSDAEDCGDREECVQKFQRAGVKVIFSEKLKHQICLQDFSAALEIYRLLKKEKFDIVHTHSTKPGIIGRITATMAGVPFIIHTVHGLAFHKFVKFPRWQFYWACEMFAALFCDKIVLVNKYYRKYFKWIGRKVMTIYNGIDFSILPVYDKIRENEEVKVLFVGRLDTPKDPLTFLKAARLVVEKHPAVRFTMVGDGEKYNECKEYIEREKLSRYITLEGWQNDVTPYYKTHDIFALSSIYESFGLIFLEAGFYKLPCVATDVEGIPEVLVDSHTGLLCKPRDPQLFAERLNHLIENLDKRQQLGENAYDRVISSFSAQKMAKAYQSLYQKI